MWSWDITYLPTSVKGIWLYLHLMVDVWSCKVVAWDVAEREESVIAADLVSRTCLRDRISKGRQQLLVLHVDNGNAMRAATLEVRLEELGVLGSFSRLGASYDNLLRIAVLHGEIPVRLPESAFKNQSPRLPMDHIVC